MPFWEYRTLCGRESWGDEYKLKWLAVLGGCNVDEIKSAVDFWMSDGENDSATSPESLDI